MKIGDRIFTTHDTFTGKHRDYPGNSGYIKALVDDGYQVNHDQTVYRRDQVKPWKRPSLVFFDKAGRLLDPGDLIVYGHALGRCAGLQYGRVIKIQWSNPSAYESNEQWEDTRKPKLKVQGVDTDWSFKGPELLRKAVLEFPERILKLERFQIPDNLYDMLKKVKIEE